MKKLPLPRLDKSPGLHDSLLPFCRLSRGEVWVDPVSGHKVGCLDGGSAEEISALMSGEKATLAVHDPPYNLVAFRERELEEYIRWCRTWVDLTLSHLTQSASLYVWLGADQKNGFQPFPDFMVMMRGVSGLKSRSLITMRNQRGYGTQKNWMAVRQELLYYVRGAPTFQVQYTDIPKVLRGYYKKVDGRVTDNLERSKSDCIRASNVWVDVQQVFYRMEENVSGCYAQKPLKAIDRIVSSSSAQEDLVVDFFAHSGSTLLSCERLGRRCFTADIDPLFCEITIRRLERFREKGLLGWQNSNPFEQEIDAQELVLQN